MEIMEETKMTAWEELNGRPSAPSTTLALLQAKWEDANQRAQPCPSLEFMQIVGRNLTLCSPSGMTENDRNEWLKVALGAIGNIPQDLLVTASAKAMRACDHPAKIVPFICKETDEHVEHRRQHLARCQTEIENYGRPRLERKSFELPETDRRELSTDIGQLVKDLELSSLRDD